jgi:hypothetical protein
MSRNTDFEVSAYGEALINLAANLAGAAAGKSLLGDSVA